MKKTLFTLVTLALVAMAASCGKDDQPTGLKRLCEIGNTGKAVSFVSYSTYKDGSQTRVENNADIRYNADYTKINALDCSEGIPGVMMKDHSYIINGDSIVDEEGKIAYNNLRFNDKGYIVHLEDFTQPIPNRGVTHTSYDVEYNGEERMTRVSFTYRDSTDNPVFTWDYELSWEEGLLKSITSYHNGEEEKSISFAYGSQNNVFRQPTSTVLRNMNQLSLDPIRSFLVAGYFGKGPDKFEVSSHEQGSSVAEDRTYSVELDAEGKINVLHETYGEGSHADYTFTYSDIE